jgi:hypothetical protein
MIEGEYLLRGVRDRLRKKLTNISGTTTDATKQSIQITVDEKVPPIAGEEFIGMYGVQFRNLFKAQSDASKESYTLSVGITRRIQAQPIDRIGDTIYTEDTKVIDRAIPSMLARARTIINLVDGSYDLMNAVNSTIGTKGCLFLTPLGLISADAQPSYVDEEHFFTEPDANKFHTGLFLEIVFGEAELIRPKYP